MYQLCSWIAAAAGMAVLFVILVSNIMWSTVVDKSEVVYFNEAGRSWLVAAALLAVLGALLIHRGENIKEDRLFWVFAAGYLAAGIYLIFSITPEIRSDAQITHCIAADFFYRRFPEFSTGGYM